MSLTRLNVPSPDDLQESAFQRWYCNSPRLGPPIVAFFIFLLALWILLVEVVIPRAGKTTTVALTGVGLFVGTGTCVSSLIKWQTVRRYVLKNGPPGTTVELGNTHCKSSQTFVGLGYLFIYRAELLSSNFDPSRICYSITRLSYRHATTKRGEKNGEFGSGQVGRARAF
jgi:hypothetical protein